MNIQKAPSTNALKFQDKAREMSRLMKGSAINTIKAGRILMEVQEGFRDGEHAFVDWIDHNFHLTRSTAYRWIEKTKKFEGRGMIELETMHPTALMQIASMSCPDEITAAVLLLHGRSPITDPAIVTQIMQEFDIQKTLTQGKENDGKATAKNIIKYIERMDLNKYTDQERGEIRTAWEAKLR